MPAIVSLFLSGRAYPPLNFLPHLSLFACLSSPLWNPPSFTVKLTLASPRSHSDPPLSPKAQLLLTSSLLHLTIWCSGLMALILFLLAEVALVSWPTAYLVTPRPIFPFLADLVYSSFSAEACIIRQAIHWSRQHQICHFSSPPPLFSP